MRTLTLLLVLLLIQLSGIVQAATLQGEIYNTNLDQESNVVVNINSVPAQQFLSKDGFYSFNLPAGSYNLSASKNGLKASENIIIVEGGTYVYDLFLLPDVSDENQLLQESDQNYIVEVFSQNSNYAGYIGLVLIFIFALVRIFWMYRK